MKITFLTTQQAYWGGSEELWVRSAELAINQGHQVQVVVYGQQLNLHPKLLNLKNCAYSFVEIKENRPRLSLIGKGWQSIISKIRPLNYKKINKFTPDFLFVNQVNMYSAPFHPELFKFLLSFKKHFFLISQFNDEHSCLTYLDIEKARTIFRKAACIFFVSKRNKAVAERQLANKITNGKTIDNPLNLEDIQYIPFPSGNDIIIFASVARLEVNFKGQDILFQIFAQEEWRGRNWHLNIYGVGPDEKYLHDLGEFYGISDYVTFHGQVTDIKKVWQFNHVLLMPSIAEGKPLALQEAMICGRIAIASDVAGNSELIDDGINGYVSSSFFPKPFSYTLEKAWSERKEWEEMGKKAHEKMITTLDLNPHRTLLKAIDLKYDSLS